MLYLLVIRQIDGNAVDYWKSNIEYGAVPLRQISTKCTKIKQAYEVLCAKWKVKFGAKIFSHYTDIVIFVLGYFNLVHPVYQMAFDNVDQIQL